MVGSGKRGGTENVRVYVATISGAMRRVVRTSNSRSLRARLKEVKSGLGIIRKVV